MPKMMKTQKNISALKSNADCGGSLNNSTRIAAKSFSAERKTEQAEAKNH